MQKMQINTTKGQFSTQPMQHLKPIHAPEDGLKLNENVEKKSLST
jgi:hypothetical protein